jgi:hypothetical protein
VSSDDPGAAFRATQLSSINAQYTTTPATRSFFLLGQGGGLNGRKLRQVTDPATERALAAAAAAGATPGPGAPGAGAAEAVRGAALDLQFAASPLGRASFLADAAGGRRLRQIGSDGASQFSNLNAQAAVQAAVSSDDAGAAFRATQLSSLNAQYTTDPSTRSFFLLGQGGGLNGR